MIVATSMSHPLVTFWLWAHSGSLSYWSRIPSNLSTESFGRFLAEARIVLAFTRCKAVADLMALRFFHITVICGAVHDAIFVVLSAMSASVEFSNSTPHRLQCALPFGHHF
jgi:hypothetical protein